MAGDILRPQSLTYRGKSVVEPVLELRFRTRSTKLSLACSFPSPRETFPPLSIRSTFMITLIKGGQHFLLWDVCPLTY